MNPEEAAKLLEPFPAEQVGKLPRVSCKACSDAPQRVCAKHEKRRCETCKAYISTAHVHLDYVGHAAVTKRLLEVDPAWSWEPLALDGDGLPLIRRDGGESKLWIRLTVCGVTRPGVGIASGVELEKQLISDALRNAAMRFGVAIDLWSKEDLQSDPPDDTRTIGKYSAAELEARLNAIGMTLHAYPDGWVEAGLPPRIELASLPLARRAEAEAILDAAEERLREERAREVVEHTAASPPVPTEARGAAVTAVPQHEAAEALADAVAGAGTRGAAASRNQAAKK